MHGYPGCRWTLGGFSVAFRWLLELVLIFILNQYLTELWVQLVQQARC